MVIKFGPTFKPIAADVVPEATVVPFTVTVAFGSAVVGVMVAAVTLFATLAV